MTDVYDVYPWLAPIVKIGHKILSALPFLIMSAIIVGIVLAIIALIKYLRK